jgi:hypothetical protein
MATPEQHEWRQLFVAALTEVDTQQFSLRLALADDSVFERLLHLEGTSNTTEERSALEEALEDIRLLRNNCFHFGK